MRILKTCEVDVDLEAAVAAHAANSDGQDEREEKKVLGRGEYTQAKRAVSEETFEAPEMPSTVRGGREGKVMKVESF